MVNYGKCCGKVYQPKIFLGSCKGKHFQDLTGKLLHYVLLLKKQYCKSQAPYNAHVTFPIQTTLCFSNKWNAKKGTK